MLYRVKIWRHDVRVKCILTEGVAKSCRSVWNNSPSKGRIFVKFKLEIVLKCIEQVRAWLKSDKIIATLHEDKRKCVMIVMQLQLPTNTHKRLKIRNNV
jgi:hypothetical protein